MSGELNLMVAGQAGQGLQLVSRALGRVLVRSGYHVFASQDVMSRIRGGHNFAYVRVADSPVAAEGDRADVLLALHPQLVQPHVSGMAPGGYILMDESAAVTGADELNVVALPLLRLAQEQGRNPVTVNSVAAGALLAMTGLDFAPLAEVLLQDFHGKGSEVAERNVAAARAGFEVTRQKSAGCCQSQLPSKTEPGARLLLSGAEAMALGAIAAGVRVVTGYPMSPATPVFEYCSRHATEAGLVVEQTEDEVAAVNLAIGASFAGARAMTCTAGGGFCLMNEGLSLAGMTETPLVMCVGMRPGPATGLATRTAQADLLFAIYAGHGEFPRAVLCPGDAVDGFHATAQALHLAEKYQTPAIVLFDQFMADSLYTVERKALALIDRFPVPEDRPVGGIEPYPYRRYEPAENGVSPSLLPGTPDQLVYADSDEHSEEGHITESAAMRVQMMDKRNRKLSGIASELAAPAAWPEPEAENLVFCFGSNRGVVSEAVARLRARGVSTAMVSLSHVWPFPAEAVTALAQKRRRVITVENNYTGQLAQLLAQECRQRVAGTVRRYDGRQFSIAEVESGLRGLIEGAHA